MSKHKGNYESSAPVSKILPASNIYRVGDYVFVETQPSHPYQIRRIEELTKTSNGQVEAKVSCFYRRRDLSNALVSQADKHSITAEEDGEINIGDDQTEEKLHQLKHREAFLSRQLEIINANTIRGKCSVTLYSEVEKLYDYLDKEDWFYYLLVYDPQQKTLLADRGEIGVGDEYQAVMPDHAEKYDEQNYRLCPETLVWDPENKLNNKQCDQFLILARSIGTFARALDCGSAVKEPSLHLSAAAASRDITLFHALDTLHQNGYDIAKALSHMIPEEGPVLCRDEMEEWSPGEASLFEDAIKKFGKEFNDIQQEFLPWKKIPSLIEYYYMWKTTDKYVQQKRMKAAEGDSKVTQIFIPSSNTAVNLTLAVQASSQYQVTVSGNLVSPNYICESCFEKESSLWYPWGPSTSQCKLFLCKDCWLYWKKYGGLKKTAKSVNQSSVAETVYKCRICSKKFNRAERLSNHMVAHKGLKCTVAGCDKSFTLKAHLSRHIAMQHSSFPEAKKLKVKTPFYMRSSPGTQIARHLCKSISRWQHFARIPYDSVNFVDVKAECINSMNSVMAKKMLDSRKVKQRKPIDDVVQIMKKIQKEADRINVQKPHIISNIQHQHHSKDGSGGQTSIRKLMSPSKSTAGSLTLGQSAATVGNNNISVKPSGSTRSQIAGSQHHLASSSHKRPLDVSLDHNGIDDSAPMSKRHNPVTSPLGRTGLGCHICGKIFHNQANLNHHMQMHDKGVINVSQQYSDSSRKGSPFLDHGSSAPPTTTTTTLASTAATTASVGYQSSAKLPVGTVTNGGIQQTHGPSRQTGYQAKGHTGQRTGRNFSTSVPQKRQINKHLGEFIGKDGDPHFVDPPQEFFFKSTKEAKKSRRSLPTRVQRKIARKPFIQIKCSQELRDSILCKKTQQQRVGNMEAPIVIDD